MKTATTLAAIVGLLSTLTEAINLQERVNEELRVVSFDIERRVVKNPVARDRLRRRTTTLQASLDNEACSNMDGGYPTLLISFHRKLYIISMQH